METIGSTLRAKREEQNLSLESAHESTKISMQNLTALEDDRFDAFPNRVYARAFLRDYANFLGLDSAALLKRYETDWSSGEQKPEPVRRAKRPIAARIGVAAFLIILAGGATLLYYSHKEGWIGPKTHTEPPPVTTPGTGTVEPGPTSTPTTQPNPPTPPGPAVPSPTPGTPPTGTLTSGTSPSPEGVTPPGAETAIPAVPLGQVKVSLTAVKQPVWISVRQNGGKPTSTTLVPGSTASFVGKKIWVRAGAAGYLDVAVNGKSYGRFGKLRQFGVNRTFTPEAPFTP